MIMSDVKYFGEHIKGFAKKYNIGYVGQYGSKIITYADNFDTVGIENELDEFADEIGRLNKIWEKFNATRGTENA